MVNSILSTFFHFLGQQVNKNKLQVFFSPNIPDELAKEICSDVGFVRVDDLGMYLGMPLFHKRVVRSTFEFLIAKFRNKLNGCESKKLSMADRITLVKYVLFAIPNYLMSTVLIPLFVCREIEKLAYNFIWGNFFGIEKANFGALGDCC